jgi:hypothetical protein
VFQLVFVTGDYNYSENEGLVIQIRADLDYLNELQQATRSEHTIICANH